MRTNGPLLGSDEEEIIKICCSIVEVSKPCNEPLLKSYIVKTRSADVNEEVFSEEVCLNYRISEEEVRQAEELKRVMQQLDKFLKDSLGECVNDEQQFRLVTDGQLHLRQCLHPEACNKNIDLPDYYNSFYDIKEECRRAYQISKDLQSVSAIAEHLSVHVDDVPDLAAKEVAAMTLLLQRFLQEGHAFQNLQTISVKFEPGICSKYEEVDNSCVVRTRGLPWQSSDQDIARFFRGLNIAKGGVALCLSPQGRRNGEALVRFVDQEHREMALKRHKHHIGSRYIEVYRANGDDFVNVAGGNSNEAQAFLSRSGQVIVRMRGLPYDCSAAQVIEFFEQGKNSCNVVDGVEGVLFVRRFDGRATGDAFVMFQSEEDGIKALSKHREVIGSRYIELFRSTTAEVQQVITTGTRKDCIRLRGLPYEAQVEHILEFLGDHAKNIVFQGVHMVFNTQGQPSGEAFIQMDSEQSAFLAAQQRHHKYMTFGKKQRYIEVFQCSGEDMNVVLTGIPTSAQRSFLSPGNTLLTTSYGAFHYCAAPHIFSAAAVSPIASRTTTNVYPSVIYWTYPSPPGSPTHFYNGSISSASPPVTESFAGCSPTVVIFE